MTYCKEHGILSVAFGNGKIVNFTLTVTQLHDDYEEDEDDNHTERLFRESKIKLKVKNNT